MQYKLHVQLKGKEIVIVNMDETSLATKIVTKHGMFVAAQHCTFDDNDAPVPRRSPWVCSLKGIMCNSAAAMEVLPQVMLPKHNKQETPPEKTKMLYADMGAPVQVWHKTSGWATTKTMLLWIRAVARIVRQWNDRVETLVVFDCAPTHLNHRVLTEARRLRVHIVVVPSKCTWLLQPLDVYVYASLKRALRRRLAREEIKSKTGRIDFAARIRLTGQTIQEELVKKAWATQMEKVGLGADLDKLNKQLKRLTEGMDLSPQAPSQEDLLFLFGKSGTVAKVDWEGLLLKDFPVTDPVKRTVVETQPVTVRARLLPRIKRFGCVCTKKGLSETGGSAEHPLRTKALAEKTQAYTLTPLVLRPWNRLTAGTRVSTSSTSAWARPASAALNCDVKEITGVRVGPSAGTRSHVAKRTEIPKEV